MKLNKAIVFSSNNENAVALSYAANALAEASAAVVIGAKSDAEALCSKVNEVIYLGQKAEDAVVESYTGAICDAVKASEASLVLMGIGTRDRCIAAKLAIRLGAAVVTDAAAVCVEDGAVCVKRNVYGGAAEAVVKSTAAITIVLMPGGLFEETLPTAEGCIKEVSAAADCDGIKLVEVAAKQEETVDLSAAKRVVGLGRGIGSADNLPAAEAFAAKLGAELGCTRPIAEEEHLLARGRYIGVSGVTVRPAVYFAMGLSGQVQHMVGVNDSKIIVAVNKDKNAPIFQNCDIGLVADMNKVLPALTELF